MATKKKMLQAAAGNAGGEALDITDVFSTYVYDGTSAEHTITNGIDLAGEGGMIWGKVRSRTDQHWLVDSERGTGSNNNYKYLMSNLANGESDFASRSVSSFNSDGFTLQNGTDSQFNESGEDYVSWTFRKAPKFFDVVTYTGDGTTARAIPHNLGTTVGSIFIKRTDGASSWHVYHKNLPLYAANHPYVLFLNTTDSQTAFSTFKGGIPDSSNFYVDGVAGAMNASGETYVAYLFAHNDGDGEFGPDGDQDIIKCGSFTTQSSAFEVDLGFEPQWIMLKLASAGSWYMYDVIRGIAYGDGNQSTLYANQSYSEFQIGSNDFVNPTPTGFTINQNMINQALGGNQDVIYMAIRRGPLAQPESATEVFAIDNQTASSAPFLTSNFPVDMVIRKKTTGSNSEVMSRLTQGKGLFADATSAEQTDSVAQFDFNDGCLDGTSTDTNRYGWMWKRAPGYFDAVCYTGNDTARTIQHNLGVVPEMIWVKKRSATSNWSVLHSGLNTAGNEYIRLNLSNAKDSNVQIWNGTVPTDTVFSVGASDEVNHAYNSATYIAYLFASLPGISKVGSYTGNGSSQTIDCGFTSGARFVLIKRASAAEDWLVHDSLRGIISGSGDPYLTLNSTDPQFTSQNYVDPHSSGFTVPTGDTQTNNNGDTYIFYAIA